MNTLNHYKTQAYAWVSHLSGDDEIGSYCEEISESQDPFSLVEALRKHDNHALANEVDKNFGTDCAFRC